MSKAEQNKVLIGIVTSKSENLAKWYSEVLTKAELIEYYDVAGCYILRPRSYAIWEAIQAYVDVRFKQHGIENCYFPMFVTPQKLQTEENHMEGFSAEVAWVTKAGSSDLAQPIAIRPTSETIMYSAFAKWIRSAKDLPLKLNQWCPVVRWEFSHPTPFIRTREFLWQEGHTAHATFEEADAFALAMLDIYRDTYENLLAIPVVPGKKSELEQFAGSHHTYTIEAFVPSNGRSIQAATAHNLGSNFAKIFGIQYEPTSGVLTEVYQVSFGLSTRSIGAMILIHSDDDGLVLPPRVAKTQVVVVPIIKKGIDCEAIYAAAEATQKLLQDAGVRCEVDLRQNYSPGYKFNDWEMKGCPLRIEIGPRDLENNTCRLARRVDKQKFDISRDGIAAFVQEQLETVHTLMYTKALEATKEQTVFVNSIDECASALNHKCKVLAHWCGRAECEKQVKAQSQQFQNDESITNLSGSMKTLCIPLDQSKFDAAAKCFACPQPAICVTYWGRSY